MIGEYSFMPLAWAPISKREVTAITAVKSREKYKKKFISCFHFWYQTNSQSLSEINSISLILCGKL